MNHPDKSHEDLIQELAAELEISTVGALKLLGRAQERLELATDEDDEEWDDDDLMNTAKSIHEDDNDEE